MATDRNSLLRSESSDAISVRLPSWLCSPECKKFSIGIFIAGVVTYLSGGAYSAAKGCSFAISWKSVPKDCHKPAPSASPSPSPSPSAVASCEPPGMTNPIYIHHPKVPSTASLCGITITGNGTNYLVQPSDAQGCIFSFKHLTGTAEALTEALCGQTVNITKSPFGGFATVVQIDNPQCSTESLLISGGDAERRLLHKTRHESSRVSHEASLAHPAVLAMAQHAAGKAIAVAAEKVRPGSGPMAETVTSMATGAVRTAITGDLVPLAQAALTLVNTRATGRKSRLAVAGAGAALQAVTGNVPGAVITLAATGTQEAASSQTTRNAINATSVAALLYFAAGTSAPVATVVAVVNFSISQAAEAIKPPVFAVKASSAKAPLAPEPPKTPETWPQWGARMASSVSGYLPR